MLRLYSFYSFYSADSACRCRVVEMIRESPRRSSRGRSALPHTSQSRAKGTKLSEAKNCARKLTRRSRAALSRSLATPSRYSSSDLSIRAPLAPLRTTAHRRRTRERAILRRTFYKVVGTRLSYENAPRDEETRESREQRRLLRRRRRRRRLRSSLSLSLFFSFLSLSSSSSRFAPLLSRHPRVPTSLIFFTYRVLLATST